MSSLPGVLGEAVLKHPEVLASFGNKSMPFKEHVEARVCTPYVHGIAWLPRLGLASPGICKASKRPRNLVI